MPFYSYVRDVNSNEAPPEGIVSGKDIFWQWCIPKEMFFPLLFLQGHTTEESRTKFQSIQMIVSPLLWAGLLFARNVKSLSAMQ